MHLLLVEDDTDIAKNLKILLENESYTVDVSFTIKEAIENTKKREYDFFILDIGLPDGSGLSFFEQYIKSLNKPTIFLTAKEEEDSIVKGLLLGAEDYITKPFSAKELVVRINKILARNKKNTLIQIKDIKIDLDKMEVYKGEEKVNLTSLEWKIVQLLTLNKNKVVTRESLLDHIWDWTGNDVNDNTITVYLKRIREKLCTDCIVTLKGIGYRMDIDEK